MLKNIEQSREASKLLIAVNDRIANLEKKRAEGVGYIYTVRSGDNLGLIAKRNRTTVKEIMKWNKLKSSVIRPGQKLRIEKPKPRA